MTKVEKFKKLINVDLAKLCIDICYDHMFDGTRVFIYPMQEDFDYVYRQVAYYTSTWEHVYVTDITMGYSVAMFFEGEVFEL